VFHRASMLLAMRLDSLRAVRIPNVAKSA